MPSALGCVALQGVPGAAGDTLLRSRPFSRQVAGAGSSVEQPVAGRAPGPAPSSLPQLLEPQVPLPLAAPQHTRLVGAPRSETSAQRFASELVSGEGQWASGTSPEVNRTGL